MKEEYKIGRYYKENIDQFRKDTGYDVLERSVCLVLDKTLQSEKFGGLRS